MTEVITYSSSSEDQSIERSKRVKCPNCNKNWFYYYETRV